MEIRRVRAAGIVDRRRAVHLRALVRLICINESRRIAVSRGGQCRWPRRSPGLRRVPGATAKRAPMNTEETDLHNEVIIETCAHILRVRIDEK